MTRRNALRIAFEVVPVFLFGLEFLRGYSMSIEHPLYTLVKAQERDIKYSSNLSNPVRGIRRESKGCEAVLGRRSSWSILDASAPLHPHPTLMIIRQHV